MESENISARETLKAAEDAEKTRRFASGDSALFTYAFGFSKPPNFCEASKEDT